MVALETTLRSFLEAQIITDPREALKADYSCSTTPVMKVFCHVSFRSEFGSLGAAVMLLERGTGESRILDFVFDR